MVTFCQFYLNPLWHLMDQGANCVEGKYRSTKEPKGWKD